VVVNGALYKRLGNSGELSSASVKIGRYSGEKTEVSDIVITQRDGDKIYNLKASSGVDTKDSIHFSDGFELKSEENMLFISKEATYDKRLKVLSSKEPFWISYKHIDVDGIGYKIDRESQKLEAQKIKARVKNI